MAINYFAIKKECALRTAQLIGTDAATLEAAYTDADFTASLDGSEVPASSFKSVILMIEEELCHIIASDVSHPYRSFIYARSADLANLSSTPVNDNNSIPFIGLFDSVSDSATGRPLTAQPTQTLDDYENSFFSDTALWNFAIVGQTLQHTRPLAYLQGCSFDKATASDNYDDDGDSPLPEMLSRTWIAGVVANMIQVGWTDGAAALSMYNNLYQQGLQILQTRGSGNINLPLASQANQVAG